MKNQRMYELDRDRAYLGQSPQYVLIAVIAVNCSDMEDQCGKSSRYETADDHSVF